MKNVLLLLVTLCVFVGCGDAGGPADATQAAKPLEGGEEIVGGAAAGDAAPVVSDLAVTVGDVEAKVYISGTISPVMPHFNCWAYWP